jgi:hypothetical protein
MAILDGKAGERLRTQAVTLIRRPEANLSRLPIGLDLRAINVVEGLRAALSVAVLVALNQWLQWPAMMEAALAAWLACLCDQGGPIGRWVPAALSFTAVGVGLPAMVASFQPFAWAVWRCSASPLSGFMASRPWSSATCLVLRSPIWRPVAKPSASRAGRRRANRSISCVRNVSSGCEPLLR